MNSSVLLVVATIVLLLAASILSQKRVKLKPLGQLNLKARRPLTAREEQMYFRLTEALTNCAVFPQIPLATLLTTTDRRDRNRFDRKIADFLICTKKLTPIAVIELDDSTHNNRKAADADRDAMLRNAGYQTIRYRDFPPAEQIRQDIEAAFKKISELDHKG